MMKKDETNLQTAGDGLHGDRAVCVRVQAARVHLVREGVAQRNGSRQHLYADEEILVAGRHGSRCGGHAILIK